MRIGNFALFERVRVASAPPQPTSRVASTPRRGRVVTESDKGQLPGSTMGDKLPHPTQMNRYDELNRDAEVGTAIETLANMVAGVGFYTEMPEGVNPEHPSLQVIDDWAEAINLDEKAPEIERIRLGKGFCPVEILSDNDLKVLPPEMFYIHRTPKGEVYRYTQESMGGQVLAEWNKAELKSILLFKRNEDPTHPYGKALIENIIENVDMRKQMSFDVPDVIHKYAYPFRVWEADTKEIMDTVYNAFTGRAVDEDIFLENIQKEQLRIHTETMDPRINFTEYIVHNDEQIAEALHAPLLIYLRNATEASATKMLETIELDVQASQRYDKRRYEMLFRRVVGDPAPRLIWGSPKSGLEDLTLGELTDAFSKGSISYPQVQDLMKKLGLPLVEAAQAPAPTVQVPGAEPAPIPIQLQTQLLTIEKQYQGGKITLSEALREGNQCISSTVNLMKEDSLRNIKKTGYPAKALPATSEQFYNDLHNSIFYDYKARLVPTGKPENVHEGRVFKVEVVA